MKPRLTIAHLYPDEMNIYGDRGNTMALIRRLQWRGIGVNLKLVGRGDKFDFKTADIIFGGGGQDRGQLVIAKDLQARATNLVQAADAGVAMLMICGLYQLFGHGFKTKTDQFIPGIGVFRAETHGSDVRMIGNIVVKTPWGRLVGFENHSGQTRLGRSQESLGRVVKGFGNNDSQQDEGAVYKNVFGSYMHGPLLPKNPHLADELIRRALGRKYGSSQLALLDDGCELAAAARAAKRPQ